MTEIIVGKQYWAIGFLDKIEFCTVTEIKNDIANVKYQIGSSYIHITNLFETKEKAEEERQKRHREEEEKIAKTINTPEDLLKMMFHEMVFGAEFPNGRKIAVAKQKAKEIFGVEL